MISLTMEEKVHYNKQKVCYICKKEFDNNYKKQQKVRDIDTTQVNIEVQLIIFVI